MTLTNVSKNIWRGSQPTTHDDWSTLVEKLIAYCLDLQTGSDFPVDDGEPKEDEQTGLLYGIITYLFPLSEFIPPSKSELNAAVNWIVEKAKFGAVLVHCLAGKDRTGMVIAWYRIRVCGWSKADAVAEMKANGFHWWYFYWVWVL